MSLFYVVEVTTIEDKDSVHTYFEKVSEHDDYNEAQQKIQKLMSDQEDDDLFNPVTFEYEIFDQEEYNNNVYQGTRISNVYWLFFKSLFFSWSNIKKLSSNLI